MLERHPIDDLFRSELRSVAQEPPAHLRGAVLAAVRGRRRWALWRRRGILLAVLLVGFWTIRYEMRPGTAAQESGLADRTNGHLGDTERSSASDNSRTEVLVSEEGPLHDQLAPTTDTSDPIPSGTPSRQPASTVGDRANDGDLHNAASPSLTSTTIELAQGSVPQGLGDQRPETHITVTRDPNDATNRLSGLACALSFPHLSRQPIAAARPREYVLPNGQWWLAPHVATLVGRRHWEGSSTHLAGVLNRAEQWTPSVAVGLMGGRVWRSGVGFGIGAELERGEQIFKHEEAALVEEQTVVTNMVTLGAVVYATTYDTLVTPVIRPMSAEGADRRTIVRVPLEAFVHTQWRRWTFGPRLGVIGEYTSISSTSSLVQEEGSQLIRSRSLGAEEVRARYPFTVMASVGADIGFMIHERWTVLATPLYARSISGNGSAAVSAAPERAGVRFQLCHFL